MTRFASGSPRPQCVFVQPATLANVRARGGDVEADELTRELIEIDENLMRAELSDVERSQHLNRRVEIISAKSALINDEAKPGPKTAIKKSAKEVAEKTGKSQRSVEQSRARAEKIPADLQEEIKGTGMDKGVELDALIAKSRTLRLWQASRRAG